MASYITGHKQDVLDHGYVEYVEHMGSDERIIEAARMSTGGGFVSWDPYEDHPKGDQGLLSYLWKKRHSTPFEMCSLVIEVKAPILVYRQWHRHRTLSYNEESARYKALEDCNYVPSIERMMMSNANSKNKQQRGTTDGGLTIHKAKAFRHKLRSMYAAQEGLYREMLAQGVSRELARTHLPVGRYSTMRVSGNLLNWLKFLNLRLDSHAQWEIRQYALAVEKIIKGLYPRTWALFNETRLAV